MKILADVAPFSPEYKIWRQIAQRTVTDPELIEEMDEIRERVNQQGKKHDFYEYKVVGHGIDYHNVVVEEILGHGKFRSGNKIFKLAGAKIKGNQNESMEEVLGRYIHVGQEITVATDDDMYTGQNNDALHTINAAVFVNGENVAKSMIASGDASQRKGDQSSVALLADMSSFQRGLAWVSEKVAHVDLPWISDQFLRVRSPLESYKAENVYGTPYQTWEHPINTFLMPALERAIHDPSYGTSFLYDKLHVESMPAMMRHLTNAGYLFLNRGAFIGAALSQVVSPGLGETTMKAARISAAATRFAHVLTGGNDYFDATVTTAYLGYDIARFFEKSSAKGAAIGAAVGAVYHALRGGKEWVPDRAKKNWDMQDYFDRLTYLKYQGLYHQAALKAKEEEGVDVEDFEEMREERQERIDKAMKRLKRLKKSLQGVAGDSDQKSRLIDMLNTKIKALDSEVTVMPGGEWTRTALLYKQAADSTMYGLKEGSSWSQIITALPRNDREYFMEFVKERNPEKREDILNSVSPALQKALSLAWGKKPPKTESNESYFRDHDLPVANWAGWSPNVDLEDVQVKTIENEAMNLSDFGYYESQLRDEDVINAPTLKYDKEGDGIFSVRKKLRNILQGSGLKDVDISVEAGPTGGATTIKASIRRMLGMREQQRQINSTLQMQSR